MTDLNIGDLVFVTIYKPYSLGIVEEIITSDCRSGYPYVRVKFLPNDNFPKLSSLFYKKELKLAGPLARLLYL